MTTDNGQRTTDYHRWLHYWAVLTVCATVVLLVLGSVVTTLRVGMADPIWPTYPWHLLLISWEEPKPGFLIEHSHRLAGYIVGCCVIVLAAGLWFHEKRQWLRWLGVTALLLVIIQGLLGGFRVKLNALVGTDLALIHGCFAQVVFAVLVSLAVFTSRGWSTPQASPTYARDVAVLLRTWSLRTALLVWVQIIFGAVLRHTHSPLGQRAHLLVAFVVVAAVAWLVKLAIYDSRIKDKPLTRAVSLLGMLVILQILLGVEVWLKRYASGVLPELQQVTVVSGVLRTAHFLVGSLLSATALVTALRAYRLRTVPVAQVTAPGGRLEEAA